MSLSSFNIPSGGFREVRPCSAQLVATYGPDGRCLHQEVIIHLLPSSVHGMTLASFFNPLQSHGLGTVPMNYPSKCSSVITSIYVGADNPRTFRCGIRAFYPQENKMQAQAAITSIDNTIAVLQAITVKLEENDTYDFDIQKDVDSAADTADSIEEYIDDQLG